MSVTMPWHASAETPVNGVGSKIDDVRRSLSKEAEHLAEMAARYGREAAAHASDIADDASKQASKIASDTTAKAQTVASDSVGSANNWGQQLIKGAAEVGAALAVSSRKVAKDANQTVQSTARDARNLRLTTEPQKTGPDFAPGITLLAGFGAGIALMYYLDPERGRARRNMLRDKLLSWTRKATQTASGTAKDLSNRAQGAVYETRKQMTGSPDTDTQTWETSSAAGNGLTGQSKSDGSLTAYGSSDPSTTDTWGEQPQPSSTSTEIEVH